MRDDKTRAGGPGRAPVADAEKEGSRSVRRVLDIFELIAASGQPVSVPQIVATLSIPKSTVYELARTLTDAGYLSSPGRRGGLFLGRKLFELGMAYRNGVDLLRDGAPVVEGLRDRTGETVQLSVLDDRMMLVLMKEEGVRPLRIISRVGSRVPVNWAAAGRLLVSDLEDAPLRALLAATVRQSPTGRAETDVERLLLQIRRARRQGYAIEVNEANEHAGCVAAPVTDGSGRCVAALSIAAPEQRLNKRHRAELIAAVREAAEDLTRRLGG